MSGVQRRLLSAAVVVTCGIATILIRRWTGRSSGIISPDELGGVVLAFALIGAFILPWFLAPRRSGWLMPLAGALATPLIALPIAALPEAAGLILRGKDVAEVALLMAISALAGLVVAWPVFLVGVLGLNWMLRRRSR